MFNVISLLYEHASKNPKHLAFKAKNFEISYEDFTHKISSISYYLKKLGLKQGDRVLIFIPLSLDLYVAMFAVQQIGAIAVFLDSWARKDQLKMCVEISQPKAMISLKQALQIPEIQNIPIKLSPDDLNAVEKAACPVQSVSPKETALITFTTGSSGVPKGANRTHAFLEAQHHALKKVIPYTGQELDLPVFPIFALNNLASGITTLLPEIDLAVPTASDGEMLTSQILSQNVDCTTLSPSLFIAVANYCDENSLQLPSLKRVVTGGAPIRRDNVEQFKKLAPNAKIFVLYGSTEVEPIAHIEADDMLQTLESGEGVNVGTIAEGLDYKLVKITKEPIELDDWSHWQVDEREVGELVVSGAHVCEGYYNDEVSFKRAKIREQNGKIWHRTGDVGFFNHGYFWFVGRVHNVIHRKGAVLFPLKAELLMKKFPEVKQAAFLSLGEETVAVISLKSKKEGLLAEVKACLEMNGIPVDQIRTVDAIPMDPRHHSKVEYEALRKLL
jgi:olefin beta-lactone synthetase